MKTLSIGTRHVNMIVNDTAEHEPYSVYRHAKIVIAEVTHNDLALAIIEAGTPVIHTAFGTLFFFIDPKLQTRLEERIAQYRDRGVLQSEEQILREILTRGLSAMAADTPKKKPRRTQRGRTP